jgi:hypothetical protein
MLYCLRCDRILNKQNVVAISYKQIIHAAEASNDDIAKNFVVVKTSKKTVIRPSPGSVNELFERGVDSVTVRETDDPQHDVAIPGLLQKAHPQMTERDYNRIKGTTTFQMTTAPFCEDCFMIISQWWDESGFQRNDHPLLLRDLRGTSKLRQDTSHDILKVSKTGRNYLTFCIANKSTNGSSIEEDKT